MWELVKPFRGESLARPWTAVQQNYEPVALAGYDVVHRLVRRSLDIDQRVDQLFRLGVQHETLERFFVPLDRPELLYVKRNCIPSQQAT